ncbi:hypothetical protein K438DRAFT_1770735 [Mycena galopus ATCC 62051]|nr:hypothetical protein K438DRAFT_1770735 [Mycena galopus ATCC 62051]
MLIGTGFAYKLLAKIGPRDLAELLARKQCIRAVPLDTRTSLNKRGLLVRSVDTAFAMRLIQRSLASNFPVKPISAKSHVLLHQDPPSSADFYGLLRGLALSSRILVSKLTSNPRRRQTPLARPRCKHFVLLITSPSISRKYQRVDRPPEPAEKRDSIGARTGIHRNATLNVKRSSTMLEEPEYSSFNERTHSNPTVVLNCDAAKNNKVDKTSEAARQGEANKNESEIAECSHS